MNRRSPQVQPLAGANVSDDVMMPRGVRRALVRVERSARRCVLIVTSYGKMGGANDICYDVDDEDGGDMDG